MKLDDELAQLLKDNPIESFVYLEDIEYANREFITLVDKDGQKAMTLPRILLSDKKQEDDRLLIKNEDEVNELLEKGGAPF